MGCEKYLNCPKSQKCGTMEHSLVPENDTKTATALNNLSIFFTNSPFTEPTKLNPSDNSHTDQSSLFITVGGWDALETSINMPFSWMLSDFGRPSQMQQQLEGGEAKWPSEYIWSPFSTEGLEAVVEHGMGTSSSMQLQGDIKLETSWFQGQLPLLLPQASEQQHQHGPFGLSQCTQLQHSMIQDRMP